MAFKLIVLCASALFVQALNAQCIGNPSAGYGLAGSGISGAGLAGSNLLANSGYGLGYNGQTAAVQNPGFVVTSTSPIAPTGISVLAENLAIEGPLIIEGQLPLLATVALEGAVPTGGQAGTTYGCGNGNIGIVSEIGNTGAGIGGYGAGIGNAGIGAAGLGNGIGAGIGAANYGAGIGAANYGAGLGAAGLGLGAGLGGGCGRIL